MIKSNKNKWKINYLKSNKNDNEPFEQFRKKFLPQCHLTNVKKKKKEKEKSEIKKKNEIM